MFRKIVAILLCLSALASVSAQTEKMRIAVFDLTPKSREVEADSAMLSEMLRNEFIKTGRFEVVSREQTSRIMSEAEFQGTGVTSAADAIKIGKLLNVRRAIVGSVGTLGGTVFVTVQLFDLETGRFITAESMDAPKIKDIVSRMRSTVSVLTTAAYRIEGVADKPLAAPEPAAKPEKQIREARPAPAPGAYPRLVNYIGYGTAAIGLGSLAAGFLVFDRMAVDAYEAAVAARALYDSAIVGADFAALLADSDAKTAAVAPLVAGRLICYIAGGVLTAGGVVLAILPPPRQSQAIVGAGWSVAALASGAVVTLSY